jgi:hypothetical protein
MKTKDALFQGVTLGHARSSDVVANFCFESPESLSVHLPSFEALKVDLAFPSKKCSSTNFVGFSRAGLSRSQLRISPYLSRLAICLSSLEFLNLPSQHISSIPPHGPFKPRLPLHITRQGPPG